MRPSCLFCATKHLSQALILLSESLQGYPTHRWLAYGHMAEASDELIQNHGELAEKVRTERKRLEQSAIEVGRTSIVMELLKDVSKLLDTPIDDALRDMQPGDMMFPRGSEHYLRNASAGDHTADFFTIEDASGKRQVPVNVPTSAPASAVPSNSIEMMLQAVGPGATTIPPGGCGSCAERARQISEAQEAIRAAQEAGENLHAVLSEEDAKLALKSLDDQVAASVNNPDAWVFTGNGSTITTSKDFKSSGAPERGTIVILTTLNDFSPSYSLSTCIKDQALALANRGYAVTLYVQENARVDANELPGVVVVSDFPSIAWKEDTIEDSAVQRVVNFLLRLPLHANTTIVTHDLMFQSWFVSAAKAIHWFANQRVGIPGKVRWYHVAHSSVGVRPQAANDLASAIYWRTNLPAGHTPVCLSEVDLDWFDRWYNLPAGTSQLIRNIRDPRTAWSCSPAMVKFISKHELATADVVCLLPLSLPRWKEKGVLKALDCFAKVKAEIIGYNPERQVRFMIAAAHANDPKDRAVFEETVSARMEHLGLASTEVICTYEDFPEISGPGLGQADMDVLWRLSNLFIFPTISEAGSLVLLEAIAANCVLILNGSVQALRSYASDEQALWVPWGSQKSPAPLNATVVEDVEHRIAEVAASRLAARFHKATRGWEDLADDWDALLSR